MNCTIVDERKNVLLYCCDSSHSPGCSLLCENGGTPNLDCTMCDCPMGLTGETCTTDINECDDLDRCLSGSTCRNEFGGYRCECAPGFTGQNCGEDINECINNPCLNGGVCTNEIGSFSCNCTDGYLGEMCGDVEPCFRNCSEACLPGMVINFIYFWQVRILTAWL